MSPHVAIVIPTVGRPCLGRLLESLAQAGAGQEEGLACIVLADDRRPASVTELAPAVPTALVSRLVTVPSAGRGPAAARNAGWRAVPPDVEWVAFLDDDVVVPEAWLDDLADDLAAPPSWVAGSQGRIRVPMPRDRAPTDWERNVQALEEARWATADMAYRRSALVAVGGFDERFPRAYREDADLGLRVTAAGWAIAPGRRGILHPVRPADRWISLRLQAGNADDALMRAVHGPAWRAAAGVPQGRRSRHALVTAAAGMAFAGVAFRRQVLAWAGAVGWLAGTAEFAAARIAGGPGTAPEIATMVLTSALIPPVAMAHWARGFVRARRLTGRQAPGENLARRNPVEPLAETLAEN